MDSSVLKVDVISLSDSGKSSCEVSSSVFGLPLRKDILHRVVNWQLAKRRAGTHKTKVVGEVSGSTAKPFKQKGTGNARQGSKYAVQMRGGGVSFGPVVRSHAHSLPKKIRRLGLKTALSQKLESGSLFVVDMSKFDIKKTSELAKSMKESELSSVTLIYGDDAKEGFLNVASNIKGLDLLNVNGSNVYSILRRDKLLITKDALDKLQERLS